MSTILKTGLILFIFTNMAFAQQPADGKKLFEGKCARCHGKTGTKGMFGAANLQVSQLDDSQLFQTITKGKNWMPSWERKLKTEEITIIITYIKTLRRH